eukprot:TRINITY_DN65855_c0_g1_i1.p1 TRINITY_DN65855_c0_g1~~TRINITY_DN65855_c0_g1_i1.p1  ORF type:complete len:247 (+),score=50.06 TRINITY_DN65855_c0_g1_i1:106-741(+)
MAVEEESLFDVTAETVDANLIFFGIDNAGKSTLVQMLKNDRIVSQQPTLHPSQEEIIIDKVRFRAFDLAGHETGRRLWHEYFGIASAIFFLVDAADRTRFPEAAEEIQKLVSAPALEAVPIAVLGMKTDLGDAASEDEFREGVGLKASALPSGRPVDVFMCSIVDRRGYGDAIRWLSQYVLERRVVVASAGAATSANKDAPAAQEEDDLMV